MYVGDRIKGQWNDKCGKDEKIKNFRKKTEGNKHRRRWEDTFKKDNLYPLGVVLNLGETVMLLFSE
jgi:hypothetical protein